MYIGPQLRHRTQRTKGYAINTEFINQGLNSNTKHVQDTSQIREGIIQYQLISTKIYVHKIQSSNNTGTYHEFSSKQHTDPWISCTCIHKREVITTLPTIPCHKIHKCIIFYCTTNISSNTSYSLSSMVQIHAIINLNLPCI